MERKKPATAIVSARRQRYSISPVHAGLVTALQTLFKKRNLAADPMAIQLLAQQIIENYTSANLDHPLKAIIELNRLAEIGYRMIVPYSYVHLQEKILPTYSAMKDLDAAAGRLADAVQNGEQIGISGDYDCDGNCSVALMIRFLQESGVPAQRIHVHIPNRVKEGYGVNTAAIEAMAQKTPPVTFLLTLDNGTTANTPIAVAKDKHMDVAVIDHHPNSEGHALPSGALVVNPRRSDESDAIASDLNGIPDLAAVGVTWLVACRAAQILEKRGHYSAHHLPQPDPRRWLGLVAMATIGDVVSLKKPLNHALVCEGLKVIREGGDPYISTLAQVAALRDPNIKNLSESDIAFKLAPIINAPGRLGQSVAWAFLSPPDAMAEPLEPLEKEIKTGRDSLKINLEKISKVRAGVNKKDYVAKPSEYVSQKQYALMILSDEANELRKQVGAEVTRQVQKKARGMLQRTPDLGTLLLAGEDWHEGVVGIVAGRLKEEFGLPTIVASINRDRGLCKASARNILGGCGDIGQVLRDMCEKDGLLGKAGGHPMAAGTSFDANKLDAVQVKFEERLGDKARAVRLERKVPLTAIIDLSEAIGKGKGAKPPLHMLKQFVRAQEFTRPYGQGREKPRIALYGAAITGVRTTSSGGQHLQFSIQLPGASGQVLECRSFHSGGSKLDIKLREASAPNSGDTISLLIGTLEQQSTGTDTENAFTFFVEDMLSISANARSKRQAIGAALECKESALNGAVKPMHTQTRGVH